MDERRQYVRLSAKLKYAYTVVEGTRNTERVTENISAGGLCLDVNEPLGQGTRLQVEIVLANGQRIPFLGEVAWSEEYKRASVSAPVSSHHIGVRMVKISPADRELIKHYVGTNL